MRYNINKKFNTLPRKRTRSKFLIFPKRIGSEIRWLERAEWIECLDDIWTVGTGSKIHYRYIPSEWKE